VPHRAYLRKNPIKTHSPFSENCSMKKQTSEKMDIKSNTHTQLISSHHPSKEEKIAAKNYFWVCGIEICP